MSQTDRYYSPYNSEPVAPSSDAIAGGNLLAMFFKLDGYGQRVLLAQAAAMLRVQAGA